MKKIIMAVIIMVIILISSNKPQRYGDVIEIDTGDRFIINQYGNTQRYNTSVIDELKELGIYGKVVK